MDTNVNERDQYGNTDLIIAARKGSVQDVDKLLSRGYNIDAQNNYGWTALMNAVSFNSLEVVRYLINKGANPNIQSTTDSFGWTALMEAVERKNKEMVRLLLEYSATDKNIKSSEGKTALDYAPTSDDEIKDLFES